MDSKGRSVGYGAFIRSDADRLEWTVRRSCALTKYPHVIGCDAPLDRAAWGGAAPYDLGDPHEQAGVAGVRAPLRRGRAAGA